MNRLLVLDKTLDDLSDYIMTAMGWLGGRLHGFRIRGDTYGIIDPEWGTGFEWIGGGFDPEVFDLDEINDDLQDIEKNEPLWKLFSED